MFKFITEHNKEMYKHFATFGFDNPDELKTMYHKSNQNWARNFIAIGMALFWSGVSTFWPPAVLGWIICLVVYTGSVAYTIWYHRQFRKVWRASTKRYFKTKYNMDYNGA